MYTVLSDLAYLCTSCSRQDESLPSSSLHHMLISSRMPWTPTQAFAHPLAIVPSNTVAHGFANYIRDRKQGHLARSGRCYQPVPATMP